jgi:hypothetical protein
MDLCFLEQDQTEDKRDRDKTERTHLVTTLIWKILDWVEREKNFIKNDSAVCIFVRTHAHTTHSCTFGK